MHSVCFDSGPVASDRNAEHIPDAPAINRAPSGSGSSHAARAASAAEGSTAFPGEGGALSAGETYIHLSSEWHSDSLQDRPRNSLDLDLVGRIATSRQRRSFENRAAARTPADTPWRAHGVGIIVTRAIRGRRTSARDLREASSSQSVPGTRVRSESELERSRVGITASASPLVDRGTPATLSPEQGRTNDNINSPISSRQNIQSWSDATRAPGRTNHGNGGSGRLQSPLRSAENGASAGGGSERTGVGRGNGEGEPDIRSTTWFLQARRAVEERLQFPRERALALDQGFSVVRVHVQANGRVVDAPSILRTSGFEDMDRAALQAVRDASPFPALPMEVAALAPLQVDLAVHFRNPMFH